MFFSGTMKYWQKCILCETALFLEHLTRKLKTFPITSKRRRRRGEGEEDKEKENCRIYVILDIPQDATTDSR